jgi:hypothetical protein
VVGFVDCVVLAGNMTVGVGPGIGNLTIGFLVTELIEAIVGLIGALVTAGLVVGLMVIASDRKTINE